MGNCFSGGSGAQRDASSKQESQVRQGRQHRACKEENPGHKLKAEARKLKTREEDNSLHSHQTPEITPSKHSLEQAHDDSAKDLSGRCVDNAKDSASDWLSVSKQCQGGVHDYGAGPPVCASEASRIETFLAYGLDKLMAPCPELDFVLQAVCRAFSAPYASLALYHNKQCVVCNTVGFPGGRLTWSLSACPWNLMCKMPQTIACGDLLEDARFADQPWTRQGLRTYCSAPMLASNGERLGSCCFMDNMPRKVDAGMCRLLNNFGEIAVRVLERHIDLAVRLEEARQTARQLSDETAYNSQSLLEPVKVLESCPVEDVKTDQQQQRQVMVKGREGSSLDKTGAALVAKEGGWMQQLQGAGPGAEAAAVAAACQSYGAWWGDEASSAAAASAAAAAAVAKAKGKVGLGEEKIGALQRARNPQLQLCNVFQREVRDTARTADACVLLVDTGHPDWPVIYADETWKEWAGYSRDAILGRGLFELLQPAAPSVAPCRREQLQAEAQAGERFVLHGQVAVPQGKSAADLVRAMSTAGSVVSLPTLHTNVPGASSTQMGQENASECVLQSVDSNVVLGQPRRGRSSNLDSLGSNATAFQRGLSLMSHKEDSLTSNEGLRQRLPQQEHERQSLDLSSAAATSSLHPPSRFLANSIEGVPHAPFPAASPSCQKEQQKSSDFLLGTHSSIKSEQPPGACLWNASHSTDTLTPAPVNLASNPKSTGSAAGADKADKSGRSRVFDLSFRPAALDVLDCDALPLGVPSFVPMETSGRMLSLYMVRLHKRGEEVVQPANKPFEPSAKVTRVGQANPSLLAPRFFPGMRVQQVLGSGGYGTAYQGQWHDAKVVLKVQDYMLSSAKELLEAQLEVILGQLLNHPNLVHTLAHATVELPPDSLVPFSQVKQASHKQRVSKARAAHNRRSSLNASPVPCRLSFQGPRPPSHEDTHTTNDTAMRDTPASARATQPGLSCAAAPSKTAAPQDALARSSAGSYAQTGGNAEARNEKGGPGVGGGGTLADDMMHGEGHAGDEGEGGKEVGSKNQGVEVGRQLCDELDEDEELLNDDPAYWFSNADARVHRLPAMLTSLGHSLNLDLSTLLDNVFTSITSLSRHSFTVGNTAQAPSNIPPALTAIPSEDINVASHQGSTMDPPMGGPTGASGTAMTSPHHSHTEVTTMAVPSMEGDGSGGGSSCVASSALVSRQTGKPSTSGEVQTMGDETEEKQGSGGGAGGVAHKLSPFSAVQQESNEGVGDGRGHGSTSPLSSGGGQQRVDPQQGRDGSRDSSVRVGQRMVQGDGKSVEGSMGAKVEQLLAEAEAHAQKQRKQALSFPMCVRTLTMMELCDGGSLLDAIDRGWLRDGPCTKDNPVDIVKVVHVALDIASALEYLHSVGVVHADLSAGNVLLTRLPPGVKRNTGVSSAAQSSTGDMQQQQKQQQQEVANPLCSSPAAAAPAPAGASPFAAAAQSFAATPMPTVPERVPLTPDVDEEGTLSVNKVSCPQGATSRASEVTASDVGSASGATGHEFLAVLKGEFKADNIDNSTLDHNPALAPGKNNEGKFAASPPVRRYQLGNPTPKTARDMQFVAKVCDYGKARLLSPSGIVKAQAYATITHMAPEVLTDLLLSPAADMYAFGVLLWQMVCCSRPWPMMSHQQIFAVVSCNSAQLPWPNTTPLNRPTSASPGSTTIRGSAGKDTRTARTVGASAAAQPADASTDAPVLGGAPAAAAAAAGACTAVPPELVELGKACLAHDMRARPSAATAVTMLRSLLARLEAA